MGKVNRTVLHESVPTIQYLQEGGVVRTKTDMFMSGTGELYSYLGDLPYTVNPRTVLSHADIRSLDNPDGKWLVIGGGVDPLNKFGYITAGATVNNVDELVQYKGTYYMSLSEDFPVTDLTDFNNPSKWLNMGLMKGTSVTDAMNFSHSGKFVTSDEFRLLVKCANHLKRDISNVHKLPATLEGSSSIDIHFGFSWGHARIDVTNFGGLINFVRHPDNTVVHDSTSDVVKKIKQGTFSSDKVTGLRGDSTLNDSLLIIETNTPYYYYRGSTQYRKEINYMIREGVLESPTKYPLDVNAITGITQYKGSERTIHIGDFELYIGDTEYWELVQVSNSKVVFKNVVFTMANNVYQTRHPSLLTVYQSDHFYGDNVTFQHSTYFNDGAGAGYTYNLVLSTSFDVQCCNFKGVGDGWGSTGSNDCTRVTFDKCKLGRIDFHRPAYDYMKVLDCDVGSWGILCTMIGDLYVERSTFICEQGEWVANLGIVRTRDDVGGWADGNLIMRDISIKTDPSQAISVLKGHSGSGGGIPSSSPLKNTFFNSIDIKGLYLEGSEIQLAPDINKGKGLTMPHTLSYENVSGNAGAIGFKLILNDYTPNFSLDKREYNLILNLKDCNLTDLVVCDHTGYFYTKLNVYSLNGLKHFEKARPKVEIPFQGEADFFGCTIGHFDFYYSRTANQRLYVRVFGGRVFHESNSENPNNIVNGLVLGLTYLSFNGTRIVSHSEEAMRDLVACDLKECSFGTFDRQSGTVSDTRIKLLEFSGATATATTKKINYDTEYILVVGADYNNTAQDIVVRLPREGKRVSYITNEGTISISNTDGVFTASGATPRRVFVPSIS
ncbi:tail fiber protein [Proteus phage 309]|uniref:Tail fiber protein n=1 Tax=Proteus phage 309 TaxID=2894355 RepID=A0AAE8YHP7_9CAUD|nr:tail fiber protein [Proteus phage 309]